MKFQLVPRVVLPSILLLVCLGSGVSAQQTPGSTVRGRAIYQDGQPIKGVRVNVFSLQNGDLVDRLSVLANERGEFVLTGLAAGKYYISLQGNGVPQASGMGMRIPLPTAAIPGPNDYPEITPKHDAVFTVDGSNTVDVQVKITRGGSITGKVMKSNGAAVPQAAVNLISREGTSGLYIARFSTQTDNDGNFRVDNLPPAEYLVSASTATKGNVDVLARLRGDAQVVTYHPAAIRLKDALPVRVDSGRESGGVNITLVSRKTSSVSGTVIRGSDGSPMPGVTVVLRNKESDITGPLAPGMMQRTIETGPIGEWSFSNVEEGEYQVVALSAAVGRREIIASPPVSAPRPSGPPQMGRGPRAPQFLPGPRPSYLMTMHDLNLVGERVTGIVLSINGAGSIRGIVENEGGAPLPANLVLYFEFSRVHSLPGRPVPVRVEPDGSFVLSNIQSGEAFVAAALQNGSDHFVSSAELDGANLFAAPVKIVEGAEVGPVRIKLSDRLGKVHGTVLPNPSTPELVIVFVPAEPGKQRFRTQYAAAKLASDGSFSTTLAPGEYFVLFRRSDEFQGVAQPELTKELSPTVPRVVVSAGENKITLQN